MDKICEFCLGLRPMVFCKSDSAFLCLTCDSRVHSANALSSKHPRVLLCESCGQRAAFAVCLDHQLILCKACDGKLHHISGGKSGDVNGATVCKQHRRKMVGGFTGCPTAKQFAALWGIEAASGGDSVIASFDRSGLLGESVFEGSELHTDVDSSVNKLGMHSTFLENQTPAAKKSRKQQQSQLIMEQILGLKRLQLNSGSSSSPILIRERLKSTANPAADMDGSLDDPSHCFFSHDSSEHEQEIRQGDLIGGGSLPLFQMDYMSNTTNSIDEDGADPFWQSESTTLENSSQQFWSQNMEELGGGMCEYELDCSFDDFNIPEVDLTFKNFEDLLGSDEDLSRALSDDNDSTVLFHSADKDDMSLDDALGGNSHARSSHISINEGVSAYSFIHAGKPTEEFQSIYDHETLEFMDFSSRSMIQRPSYSASLSFSDLCSNSSKYMDSENSDHSTPHWKSDDQEEFQGRKKTKLHERTAARKGKLDMNKRIKSRFAKLEVSETKAVKVTRSF